MESTYGACNLVLSICIYADPNQFQPIAIVVPAEAALRKFAMGKGLTQPNTSFEALLNDGSVIPAVHAEMLAVGKRAGLAGKELIQGLVLVPDEWTPENVLA